MMRYDLLTEPWIPTVAANGDRVAVSLRECFRRANEIPRVQDPCPIIEFGIYRLLTAILLDALTERGLKPVHPAHTRKLIAQPDFELVDAYFDRFSDRFDLFHPEHPFLQSSSVGGPIKPLSALFPAVPSGTNVVHWWHAHENDYGATPAEAAGLLTAMAPFMTSGGAGLSPSINGAPGIYALPLGASLWETLLLNIPLDPLGSGDGTVAWRSDREPGEERHTASLPESLTWRARRVRLIPSPDGTVRTMYFQAGDSTRFEWTDPSLAYKFGAEKQTPIRMKEGRPLWRDAGPLALLNRDAYESEKGKFAYARPRVVNDAFQIVERPLRIGIYGMRTDLKMKVFEWAQSELTVPNDVGRNTRVGAQIQRWMERSDKAAASLASAIIALYPRDGAGNNQAFARLVNRAERAFWDGLEPQFEGLLRQAAGLSSDDLDDPDLVRPVQAPWFQAIQRLALDAFDSVARDFDATGKSLERHVVARKKLVDALRRQLS